MFKIVVFETLYFLATSAAEGLGGFHSFTWRICSGVRIALLVFLGFLAQVLPDLMAPRVLYETPKS